MFKSKSFTAQKSNPDRDSHEKDEKKLPHGNSTKIYPLPHSSKQIKQATHRGKPWSSHAKDSPSLQEGSPQKCFH